MSKEFKKKKKAIKKSKGKMGHVMHERMSQNVVFEKPATCLTLTAHFHTPVQ